MQVLNYGVDSDCAQNSRDFWLNLSGLGGAGAQNCPYTSTTASAFQL